VRRRPTGPLNADIGIQTQPPKPKIEIPKSVTPVAQAANPKDQYLLLRALNEVITSLDSDHLTADYQAQVGIHMQEVLS